MNTKTLLTLALLLVATLITLPSTAQDTKGSKKEQREAQHRQEYADKCNEILTMVQSGNWRFTIFSIDEAGHTALASSQLKGANFVSVQDAEMTVQLPLQGNSQRFGSGVSTLTELKFVTDSFVIEKSTNSNDQMVLSGHAIRPEDNAKYDLNFVIEQNKETLTVISAGVDNITYKGSFSALKSRK